jgi:hypothetical protein
MGGVMKMYKYVGETKIVVSGDIHINLRGDYEFEKNRVMLLGQEILEQGLEFLEGTPKGNFLVILSGDIFDKAKPSFEEIGLFYEFLAVFSEIADVFVIAGNHEELGKNTVFDFIPEHGYKYIKYSEIQFNDDWSFFLIGHPYIDMICGTLPLNTKNVLVSHYRSDIGVAPSEVDNDCVSERFDLTFLSDIHYQYRPYENIIYTSSPYSIHYTSDFEEKYGFIVINISGNELKFFNRILTFPSKILLEFEGETLENIYEICKIAINPDNIYKVVVHDFYDERFVSSMRDYKNVKVVFKEPEDEDMDFTEIVDSIQEKTNDTLVDVVDKLVRSTGEVTDKVADKGKEMLEGLV